MREVPNRLSEVTLELSLPSSKLPALDHQAFEQMKKRLLEQLPMLSSRGILHIVEGASIL